MDTAQYCEILDERVIESYKLEIEKERQYFQQDNNLKHTSKQATTWFSDNNIIMIS